MPRWNTASNVFFGWVVRRKSIFLLFSLPPNTKDNDNGAFVIYVITRYNVQIELEDKYKTG